MTDFLVKIIKEAGEIARVNFRKQPQVSLKADKSLLTEADLAVERLIMDSLKQRYGSIPVLSEETKAGFNPLQEDKLFVLDPIDGTTNFAYGDSYFCISLAYVEKNQPQIGIVYAPVMDKLFVAEKGRGARMNGQKIKVSRRKQLSQCMFSFGMPSGTERRQLIANWIIDLIPKVRFLRSKGAAALEMAEIASSMIDVYLESGLNPWDFSAAMLLIKEAGGRVTDLDNQPLKMKPSHLLASNGHFHPKILSLIQEKG